MKIAADNLNALNPAVSGALRDLNPEPIKKLAMECDLPEVHFIDINPGFLSRRHADRMTFMVETVQDATRMKLILDSPDPEILARGLAVCREKPVLNALSLERHKIEGILPLAAEHGTRLVLLLMDERSRVPLSMEERIAIAVELRELALSAGLQDKDLIYDPVMPNLSWPDAEHHVREIVKTIRMLSGFSLFPEPAQTMIGLSNLRSGLRKKYPIELETTILALLAGSGLNIVLADVIQNGFIKEYNKIKPFCET